MIKLAWLAMACLIAPLPFAPAGAAEAAGDLWQRIRAGLRFEVIARPEVEAQLEGILRRKMFSGAVQRRARPYLHYIVEQVERRGLPMELALLPAVESGFQPFAESSEGATGLWQFTAATGLEHGLAQGWWYDGRRDPLASTRAALDYLSYLAGQFDGDWMLALAAYNAGIGRVRAARRASLTEGGDGQFWSLDLPLETRQYVPRVIALGWLVAQPRRYGVALTAMPDHSQFTPVAVEHDLTLQQIAAMADLDEDALVRLNAGLNPLLPLIETETPVLIPIAGVDRLRQGLAERGDGMALAQGLIREAAGRRLLGLLRKAHARTMEARPDAPTLSSLWVRERLAYHARQAQRRDAERRKRIHVVRAGESLLEIAIAYRVEPDLISEWNDLDPGDGVRPGQALIIWEMG